MTTHNDIKSPTVLELRYKKEYEKNKDTIKYVSFFRVDNDAIVINKEDRKNVNFKNIAENLIDIRDTDMKFYEVLNIMYYNYRDSMKDYDIEFFLKNSIDIERYIKYKDILLTRKNYNGEFINYKPKDVNDISWIDQLQDYFKDNDFKTLCRIKINQDDFKIMNKNLRKKLGLFDRTDIDDYILNKFHLEVIDEKNRNSIVSQLATKYPEFSDKYHIVMSKKVFYNMNKN